MKPTVIFLYSNPIIGSNGGVQKVSLQISKELERKGYNILFVSNNRNNKTISDPKQIFLKDQNPTLQFQRILDRYNVNSIINQDGLSHRMRDILDHIDLKKIKLISIIHNSPNAPVQHLTQKLNVKNKILEKFLFLIFSTIYNRMATERYRMLYKISTKIVVLSESYKTYMSRTFKLEREKIVVLPNPVILPKVKVLPSDKRNKILYVGRIDLNQKRLDHLIDIWRQFEFNYSYELIIIGDGPDLDKIRKYANNIPNVNFLGKINNPEKYYKSAVAVCLTSRYEGYPLVINEALAYNAVPVLYNSFPAAKDMVIHGRTGELVQNGNKSMFARALSKVTKNQHQYFENITEIHQNLLSVSEITQKLINNI